VPDTPPGRWSDLDRPPLDGPAVAAALVRDSRLWRSVEVAGEVGSTNADLAARYAIVGSLMLYIAFINIFLSILQILGNRR